MRAGRIAPFLVLAGATWMGGWFLQEGVAREESVYTQVRVFQEVVDYVSDQFVDDVPEEEVYQSAIDGLLGGLDDPYSSFIEARDGGEADRIEKEGTAFLERVREGYRRLAADRADAHLIDALDTPAGVQRRLRELLSELFPETFASGVG